MALQPEAHKIDMSVNSCIYWHKLIDAMPFLLFHSVFSRHLFQPSGHFLDEVWSLREVHFFLFLFFSEKREASKSFSRMLQPDEIHNRKVYCARMHSYSVWLQEPKPESHGWLYVKAISWIVSSDKDKPLHYALQFESNFTDPKQE